MANTLELVLIPAFGISTARIEMELARRVAAHDPRLSVAIFLTDFSESELRATDDTRISLVRLPPLPEGVPIDTFPPQTITDHMEAYKPVIKEIILKRSEASNGRRRLAGFVLDIFCSPMADIACELGVPYYFMFPTSASTLAFYLHFEGPLGGQLPATPTHSLDVSGFRAPLHETAWPVVIKNNDTASLFLRHIKMVRKCKGILANTCMEMEPDLLHCLSQDSKIPTIYPVGPIAYGEGKVSSTQKGEAMAIFGWLDAQPPRSVVFLFFGNLGGFDEDQAREIATGLERSGHRFLWSLHRQPKAWKGREYEDFNKVLPEGFLEHTKDSGRVVRWVPQREVLAHAAIGAHVSHCDWSALLESMWPGVPVAAWPLFADQHVNAYYWVREAGLAAEICMDDSSYVETQTSKASELVAASKVEEGIRRIMEGEEGVTVRKRLEEMSHITKNAHLQGGSSHLSMTLFIHDVIRNVSST